MSRQNVSMSRWFRLVRFKEQYAQHQARCQFLRLSVELIPELPHLGERSSVPKYAPPLYEPNLDSRPCFPCPAYVRLGIVDVKPLSIWKWFTHARAVYNWSSPCRAVPSLRRSSGFQTHFAIQHSKSFGKPLQCATCKGLTTPKEGTQLIHGLQELLDHVAARHPLIELLINVSVGKRKRGGEMYDKNSPSASKREKSTYVGRTATLSRSTR